MAAIRLIELEIFPILKAKLHDVGLVEASNTLELVLIPTQRLKGEASNFSFMAFPVPRLSKEERADLAIKEEESFSFSINDEKSIRIDFDCFGVVNWFHILGMPEIHDKMKFILASQDEKEIPFWKY